MSRGVEQKGCSPPAMAARDMEAQAPEGHNAGTENKAEAAKQRPRRQPCCGFCRNHSLEVPVINHQCDYAECTCVFCELTRRRRKVMRHQQRLWRYKKNSAGLMEGEENTSEGEVTPTCNFPHEEPQQQHMVLLDASKNTVRRKMCLEWNILFNLP
ncbi:hypothetical protein GWK47_025355 [Chionoecetes opilio]|uniref:DM domain-containing protein n=1 Tax=Chionoecetes opilio TaxID=41210 RepID=A0A8J8WN53_CHIOP|nr:hypothetical protein GWK47_025355 [Chionoecetes opilio]